MNNERKKLSNKNRDEILNQIDSAIRDLQSARIKLAGTVSEPAVTADNAEKLSQNTIDDGFNFAGTARIAASIVVEKLCPFTTYITPEEYNKLLKG